MQAHKYDRTKKVHAVKLDKLYHANETVPMILKNVCKIRSIWATYFEILAF